MASKTCPRGSPPPLVSMADTRRDSLVGLQRLVYNTKPLTQDKGDDEEIKQEHGTSLNINEKQ